MRLRRRSRVKSSRGHVRIEQGPIWNRRVVWAAAAMVVVAVIVIAVKQFVLPALDEDEISGDNRTWLEFAWTTTPINRDAIRQLAERLESNGINIVYLEATAWRSNGSLTEGQYTTGFAQALRDAYPEIKILLWLRMSGEQIAQPELQTTVIQLAGKAVGEWKLDGVQLNGRAVLNGNKDYIELLRDLRDTIGPEALLSTTVPPDRIPADPDIPIGPAADPGLTWDVNYKQQVGFLLIDEIVIMAHASGLEDSEEYETWVAYQVASYAEALAEFEQSGDIILALPTYDAAPGHDPAIEDIRTAIRGVRSGIKRAGGAGEQVKGVGLYEYKTTDSLEWAYYREHWLGLESD